MTGLALYNIVIYRWQLQQASGEVSPVLLQRLEENARITRPGHLQKAGVVGLGMLVLFLVGEGFHLTPAVTGNGSLIGASANLVTARIAERIGGGIGLWGWRSPLCARTRRGLRRALYVEFGI